MLEFMFSLLWLSCILNGIDGKYTFTGDKEVCNSIGQVNFTGHLLPDYSKVNKFDLIKYKLLNSKLICAIMIPPKGCLEKR